MTQDEIVEAIDRQRFSIERSMRYHEHRMFFWECVAFWAKLLEFATTSTAFAFLFRGQNECFLKWVVLFAAILSFLVIILDAYKRIKHNTRQRSRLGELAIRIPLNLSTVTEAQMEEIYAVRKRIELDDGIVLACLNAICHNEQCAAEGKLDESVRISFWEKHIGKYFPIPYRPK